MSDIRPSNPQDAAVCAGILNDWIDGRDWMPRVHSHQAVVDFYCDFVFANRQVWVIGRPAEGFIALDEPAAVVTALYVAIPGKGMGKALLEHAKIGRGALELWTFVANKEARRFYAREGFKEVRQTSGDNEEDLADVLMRWEAAQETEQFQ